MRHGVLRDRRQRLWAIVLFTLIVAGDGLWRAHAQPATCQVDHDNESTRDTWQRVPDFVTVLNVSTGSRVADIGAGGGFFSVRLAKVVGPTGRVYAVEINPRMTTRLRERAEKEGLQNLEVILGDANDPKLPADSLDAALIVNAYHEMPHHKAIVEAVHRALKSGGRFVISEPASTELETHSRERQASAHEISLRLVEEDLKSAGFEIVERHAAFVTRSNSEHNHTDWLLVARRP